MSSVLPILALSCIVCEQHKTYAHIPIRAEKNDLVSLCAFRYSHYSNDGVIFLSFNVFY